MSSLKKTILLLIGSFVFFVGFLLLLPTLLTPDAIWGENSMKEILEFPVTVNVHTKTITEDMRVNAYLESKGSPLAASAFSVSKTLAHVLSEIMETILNTEWYQGISQANTKIITIKSGMRKEQVASIFGKALAWNTEEKNRFLNPVENNTLPLTEGSFTAGTYYVHTSLPPESVQALVNKQFTQEILSRYSTTTREKVPLDQALIVASLIERETIGNEDMRLISGIIWNRVFAGMNLQIDSTLQYAKANKNSTPVWWPKVVPADKYQKSPFNTYQHEGLPPSPIASPSVAAVLAALNPIKTPCMYYFNDKQGTFHCSDTYKGHVALLKQYYGKGK